MVKRSILCFGFLFLLILEKPNFAEALPTKILDTEFTTVVEEGRLYSKTDWSRTTVSQTPISDLYDSSGFIEAQADAGLFEVSAYTNAFDTTNIDSAWSRASATASIQFSTLETQTTTIGLEFFGAAEWIYSWGFVRLSDVTSSQTLWNYDWDTVPWDDSGHDGWVARATLSLDTDFNAMHVYELIMNVNTCSNVPDSQLVIIQSSGLAPVPVPEPPIMLLLAPALVGLSGLRRKFQK
jgi:hypothetical protein